MWERVCECARVPAHSVHPQGTSPPSARPSQQPRQLPCQRPRGTSLGGPADGPRGTRAGALGLDGMTPPPPRRWSHGCTCWQSQGAGKGFKAKQGKLLPEPSLLQSASPRLFSLLFPLLFGEGGGSWHLGPRSWQPIHLPDKGPASPSSDHGTGAPLKGHFNVTLSSLTPEAGRLFPAPWRQRNTPCPALPDSPSPPRAASSEMQF